MFAHIFLHQDSPQVLWKRSAPGLKHVTFSQPQDESLVGLETEATDPNSHSLTPIDQS